MADVSVIGLGNMGLPMATSILRKGHSVTGFDLSEQSRGRGREQGLTIATSIEDAVKNSSHVVLSLPKATDVLAVVDAMRLGTKRDRKIVVIDTSTSEADVSRRISRELSGWGHGFLDAPVSGGTQGAASGTLSIMIGGTETDVDLARSVLEGMGSKIYYVGPSGAGNVAKLVNNLLVAAHMLTTSEALKLSIAAGVPAEAVLPVINAATGRSAVSENHFPKWIVPESFSSGFTMGLMRKDVRLALELAKTSVIDLPISEHVAAIWKESEDEFGDAVDFTKLAALRAK